MDGPHDGEVVQTRVSRDPDSARTRAVRRAWLLPLPLIAAPSLVVLAAMLRLIPLDSLLVKAAVAPGWPAVFLGMAFRSPLAMFALAALMAGGAWYGLGVYVARAVLLRRSEAGAWGARMALLLALGVTLLGLWLMSGWNPD